MSTLNDFCKCFVSRRLFYPSAGKDVTLPVSVFMPFIDEFWFVDTTYVLRKPLLADSDFDLKLESSERDRFAGTTIHANESFVVDVRRDTYTHLPTGRALTVNACRGRGYDLFRAAFRRPKQMISVFFYRGDSQGEGGSGFYWLRRPTIRFVLQQLEPNALLVSDGSNAIARLSRFHRNGDIGEGTMEKSSAFTLYGRRMKCIAYLGERYGPTLAWQIDATEQTDKREPE
jgi:hypothetical protein